MLNLMGFFDLISNELYCIIKLSDKFPEYSSGDDIDILCFNPERISWKLLEWGNSYVKEGLSIKVKINSVYNQYHIDFMEGNNIHFRFDLYGQLPDYKKLMIKPALFESIIENSRILTYQNNDNEVTVHIPTEIDEMVIRYLEFVEYYNTRPDKIKHLDYIIEKIDKEQRIHFLDRLHYYTALPDYPNHNIRQEHSWKANLTRIFMRLRGKAF